MKLSHTVLIVLCCSFIFFGFMCGPKKIDAATLSLSPTSNSVNVGSTFTVNILLDTIGQPTYGVDIYSLHFNPAVLQVVDADSTSSGVQVSAGSLMGLTVFNNVNNTTGLIQVSQVPLTGGGNFNGSGIFATVTFRAISSGTSNVTFDFTPGSTVDTNVASLNSDLLTGVGTGLYMVQIPIVPPTISNIIVSNVGTSSATISWNTSTPTNGQVNFGTNTSYGTASSLVDNVVKTTSHTVSIGSLTPVTAYHFQIVSTDASANTVTSVDTIFATLVAPDTTAPSTPLNLIALPLSQTQINLSWTASIDPIVSGHITSGISGYKVFRGGIQVATSTTNTFTDSSLASGTLYSYKVSSYDVSGNVSSQSSSVGTTTLLSLPVSSTTLIATILTSPNTGTAPLVGVSLTAQVSGTATGTPSYYFYCNRNDTTTSTSTSPDITFVNDSSALKSTGPVCTYAVPGTYTAKVIVQRNGLLAEAHTDIIVSVAPVPVGGGGGGGGGGTSTGGSGGGGITPPVPIIPPVVTPATTTVPIVIPPIISQPQPVLNPVFTTLLIIGMKNPQVILLQTYLASQVALYPTREITGYFGAATQKAVGLLQEKYNIVYPGMEGYGQVGPKTRALLNTLVSGSTTSLPVATPPSSNTLVLTSTLSFGMKGNDVLLLQTYLSGRGFLAPNNTTGYFGALTRVAVQKFQCQYGIVCSGTESSTGYGMVGKRTRDALAK